MEEHAKSEEFLSEELLESVMGGAEGASSSGGAGRIAECPECSNKAGGFRYAMDAHDRQESGVDNPILSRTPSQHKILADKFYQQAQKYYHEIRAHGHSDFPDALYPPAGH